MLIEIDIKLDESKRVSQTQIIVKFSKNPVTASPKVL